MQGQANQSQSALMQNQAAAMRAMFGMGDPQGAPQAPQGQGPAMGAMLGGQAPQQPQAPQAPQAGAASPAGAMGLPGMSPMQSMGSYFMSPDKYMDSYLKGYTPNDTTIQARQGGVDPVMANRLMLIKNSTDPKILGMQQSGMGPMQIYQAIFGEAAKGAEIDRKAGNQFYNPLTGDAGMVPKLPEGANPVGQPAANGAISTTAMPGAAPVMTANAAAAGLGTARTTPSTAYVAGQPTFSTKERDLQRAAALSPAEQSQSDAFERSAGNLRELDAAIASASSPAVKQVLQAERQRLSGPAATPEQRPGVVEAAKNAQATMNTSYKTVAIANAPAQTIQARLSAIGQLAKGAIRRTTSCNWRACQTVQWTAKPRATCSTRTPRRSRWRSGPGLRVPTRCARWHRLQTRIGT